MENMYSFNVEDVIQRLKDFAIEHDVRIVSAVNYDWDIIGLGTERSMPGIQFFYVRNTPWYLGLEERCAPVDASCPSAYHMVGYELKTALSMISEGDASMMEVFCGDNVCEWEAGWTEKMRDYVTSHFDIRSLCKRYQELAAAYTFEKIGMKAERIENVLLRLRYILCQKWLVEKKSFPPMDIMEMIESLVTDLDDFTALKRVLSLKDTDLDAYKKMNTSALSVISKRINLDVMPLVMKLPRSKVVDNSELSSICRDTIQRIWLVEPEVEVDEQEDETPEPRKSFFGWKPKKKRSEVSSTEDQPAPVGPRTFIGKGIHSMASKVTDAVGKIYDGLEDTHDSDE